MKNIIQDTGLLTKNTVRMKNPNHVNEILNNLIIGGIQRLQVVSDFDRTITKQHENGIPHLSSFAIFGRCPSGTEQFLATAQELRKKYYPIEIDPTMSLEEKIPHMEMWWKKSEEAIKGLSISSKEIGEVCLQCKPSLRDGTKELFDDLAMENVPILVFSAGCGDVVATILQQGGVYLPNVKVVSNFLNYDSSGVIQGFKDKIIHVLNKNEYAIKNTEFYNLVQDRENVIVMGDSLGDAEMAKGMDNLKTVLKIGFLYDRIEESLPSYLDTFDIVLIDDQTMEVPKAIFDSVKNSHCE
ncbi:7-methylguanosine phosphate-specific 5'-nucleotidase [Cylas formicarius]|uniref:7-methylguanosine phosphate-specific 5'-nucleotidase n=1 Tax=Cylas formicarius TaxID=197179 RepID=UPI00295878A9|nr:7-methylguanosine phosphate-specific 5'-nucleotidase [Cylas formicarius]